MTPSHRSAPAGEVIRAHGSPLRVLHFVPRECWPLDTGARLRNYHLAREVSRQCRITLLAFSDRDFDSASRAGSQNADVAEPHALRGAAEALENNPAPAALPKPEEFYERVMMVRRGRGYTPLKIARGALGRTPLPVLNYTTPEMAKALTRILGEQAFDIVQVESIHLAAYLPTIRAARCRPVVICDWHNIESDLMRRYSEHATSALRRAYALRTSRQLAALERRAVAEFDAHVVVSREEREKLLRHAAGARVHLIENGVDTEYYSDERLERAHADWLAGLGDSTARARPRRALFVGSMDYHANVDAATHFAREVWPRLSERHPELLFTIVGRDPAPEVERLGKIPGIEVTGTVDDVRPYYQEALMAVIPLRVGGGSRLKILEAMAAGVPVVSTRLGAEGIEALDGREIVLADTASELLEAVSDLAKDEGRRRRLSAGGRALVSARYDWSRLGSLLVDVYRELTTTGLERT